MSNSLAALRAARQAEGRRRMTHDAWAPPEDLQRLRTAGKWLSGPVATDDYGNEIPGDSSSLASMLNSLVPHPGQSEEQIAENTLGFMLPAGGPGLLKDLARGPVGESVLRIFAGPGAKTADHNALGEAMRMAEGGADNETIRAATSWFQGPDKKWRFEIDDSGSVPGPLKPDEQAALGRAEMTSTTRQRALLHPQLSAAYPDTKRIGVRLDPIEDGGTYNSLGGVGHIRTGTRGNDGNQVANRSTMLHELQHAIQQREGFARGGSPQKSPLFDEIKQKESQVYAQLIHPRTTGIERRELRKEYERLRIARMNANPYEAYRRLAGEVEARDVQARMDFTPEQRRAIAPYSSQGIAPEDMTINFLGGENKAITRTAAARKAGKVIGATKKELAAAQRNATEMLGLHPDNTRADRAQALARVDDPLWRGGKPPSEAGEMGNQSWFTRDKQYAEGFAQKPGNELGRYVKLKSAETFPANQPYALRQDDTIAIAEALRKDGYTKLADEFQEAGLGGEMPLSHAASILKGRTGESGLRKYFGAAGYDAVDDGTKIAVTRWGKGVMRDPERAAFDPARLGDPSIYAGIAGLGALPMLMPERSPEEF